MISSSSGLAGGVEEPNPRLRVGDQQRYGALRRRLPTAMTEGSGVEGSPSSEISQGGLTGVVEESSPRLRRGGAQASPPPSPETAWLRYLQRHHPGGSWITDPYWRRGGLQPIVAESSSDDDDEEPASPSSGVSGGVEEAKLDSEPASNHDIESASSSGLPSPPPFPFKPSTEEWAACVAQADLWWDVQAKKLNLD